MKRPIHLLALAACLLTAACSGAATASQPAATPSAAATAAASDVPSAASIGPAGASASAVAGNDGPALCAFLQAELPALQEAGSTGGAVAQLAIDYADWISADPSRKLSDAGQMDTLTEASCPSVRTAVLKTIGGNAFAGAF